MTDARIDMEFIFGLADQGDAHALAGRYGTAVRYYAKAAQLWHYYEPQLMSEAGYEAGWTERLEGKRMLAALLKDGGLLDLSLPANVLLDAGSVA